MNPLFVLAAQNTVVAILLALLVFGLTRLWRNPPAAHLLWLLVLLKLVAPPVMHVTWPALGLPDPAHASGPAIADVSPIEEPTLTIEPGAVDRPAASEIAQAPAASAPRHDFAASLRLFCNRWETVVLCVWLGGAALCLAVAVVRIIRFERLLRGTLPASERLQQLTAEIAGQLGMRRVPDVRYVESVEVPLLWCAGRRPTICLPTWLLRQFDDDSVAMVLTHELAHLRRHDHWVRVIELIVSAVYWWNPLVWVIRRQIHEAEDLCCDAWVRWALPDGTRRYAEIVLQTAELLTASQVGRRLLPASPFLHCLSLTARIEMILESRFAPSLSKKSMFAIAMLALFVIPSFLATTRTEARADSKDEAAAEPAAKTQTPAGKTQPPAGSELPYAVKFEQGATRFAAGDAITILEVRGTADTFSRGNIYCVKGSYTLASRDRAILLASATVKDPNGAVLVGLQDLRVRSDFFMPGLGRDPGNATGVELKVQRTDIQRGTGTFTLFLPTPFGGLPHVSFCSLESGGASFGGNYFGTGDSVLKEWWNTNEIRPTRATKPDTLPASEFSHNVKFEQGATQFSEGDRITILEVHGTADTFIPDNSYWIKGTYTLASHDNATLAAYTTARDAADGKSIPLKSQTTVVDRGDGTFTLFLPMSCKGWPHVSFYPVGGGGGFGGNYFGTGDSVLKEWWNTNKRLAAVANKPVAPVATEFSHVVNFEQGETRFLEGDKITILEVRGTAETFLPGNSYQIKGTYTLASHDRATLAAYITATEAGEGESRSLEIQHTIVDQGDGTFTLILPMNCKGWPHVSFYPAKGGSSFGGKYFGTGDSLHK